MKFKISRTSAWHESPCEEAVMMNYTRIDERIVDAPEKLPTFAYNEWYTYGENHRVENGHIKRDFKDKDWFIEINSLEDLIELRNKYGELIIEERSGVDCIEIYDDYRE